MSYIMELLVLLERNIHGSLMNARCKNFTAQATVVQRAGIFIHWINPIQLIKINVFQPVRFIRWIATDPLDKVIRSLNNRDPPDLSFGEF